MHLKNHIIFSGGPGAGKTSLLEQLKLKGFNVKEEVGRKVIQEEKKENSECLPWRDKCRFADEMERLENEALKATKTTESLIFLDRSIVDVYGYRQLEGLEIPKALEKSCSEIRHSKEVFMFPPWESIYQNDSERKQTFSEAVNTYQVMVSCYLKFGYSVTEMPLDTVKNRLQFILKAVSG